MATNLPIQTPNFDRIRKGDHLATEDAVRLLWLVTNNEISMRQATGAQVATSGYVVGPASATDHAVVRFDTTSGKLVQNSGVLIDDSNNLYVIGTIRERGRATPLGEWIDVAANSSYFAVGSEGAGNWDPGTIGTFAYTLIGKTLHLQIFCSGGTWSVSGGTLFVLLPAGLISARRAKGSAFLTSVGLAYETCAVTAGPGGAWLAIYRNGLTAFPAAASVTMFMELTASV